MCELEVDHLVVTHVVVALVDTPSIRPLLKSLGDIFNVWGGVDNDCDWPAIVSLFDSVRVKKLRHDMRIELETASAEDSTARSAPALV